MQVLDPPPEREREYYFFDYECQQETGKHIPNLVVVHDEKGEEFVFEGEECNDEFCEGCLTTGGMWMRWRLRTILASTTGRLC